MAQIFPRSANALARVTLFGAVFLLTAISWAFGTIYRAPWTTWVGVAREQPVPFSHKHHAGGEGFDCRYCHTSVEDSAFAGLPPTRTCMNCHSIIWSDSQVLEPVRESFRTGRSLEWTRVHDLADFVYFDHSIHLRKGIGCSTCHGRVDRMPLTARAATLHMSWCIECHRQPERFVRPRSEVFRMDYQPPADQLTLGRMLVAEYGIRKLTDCSTCHR